jgi:hypothetical protein
MKTWYRAVCDVHNEACYVMVNNPIMSKHYLEEHNENIHQWLSKHYGCELRLVWRDDQVDKLWETMSYEDAHQEKIKREDNGN